MVLAGSLAVLLAQAAPAFSPQAAFDAWPERRFVRTAAPCLSHAELGERLAELTARHEGDASLELVGRSVEGREIRLLTLGRGPRRVLLWSQMHGDEPSATPALLDVAATLLSADTPEHRQILERLTLLVLPMLNPDGASLYTRRNSQAIDINRDALELATPEGRLLKQLRDRFEPELGFNLHDQNRRTTVGETGTLATIALLAVAGDAEGTLTPGRARAKRVASAVARALAPYVPGGVSRYDEDWNPRAFGDNLTAWGTPVVLIESGGLPAGRPFTFLTRLNYVALLAALSGLARDDLAGEDPALYEGLARNSDGRFVDVLLAGGRLLQPPGSEPYRADLAFDRLDDDPVLAGCPAVVAAAPSRIREVGDLHLLTAARRRDLEGRLLSPVLAASVRGVKARSWLTEQALDAVSRLGVGTVRWHVKESERATALALADRLAAPGRARVTVVDAEAPESPLVLPGPPRPASGPRTIAAALAALTHAPWPGSSGADGIERLLALLAARAGEGPPLRPDAVASLIVLRPREAGRLDPATLELESVWLDGFEVGGTP